MNMEAELLDRIAALEERLPKLRDRVLELEQEVMWLKARPQPATTVGGAGNTVFGPAGTQMLVDWRYNGWSHAQTPVTGTNVSRETPKGPNGAAPIGSPENPLIVKDR
jgi:hypothetical protein